MQGFPVQSEHLLEMVVAGVDNAAPKLWATSILE